MTNNELKELIKIVKINLNIKPRQKFNKKDYIQISFRKYKNSKDKWERAIMDGILGANSYEDKKIIKYLKLNYKEFF